MALTEVGIMARRSDDGGFLEPVMITRDIGKKEEAEFDELPYDDIARIFADKFLAYRNAQLKNTKKETKK